jgi:hypothetical protein
MHFFNSWKEGAMKKSTVTSFIPFIILILVNLLFVSSPGPALGWSESDVNTAFKLVVHTVKNDYPGGGSQDSSTGFGYHIENWVAEPKAGYIRITTMNRSDCPGQVAKFRIEWSFSKDITILAGWTTDAGTWNRDLFTVTTQILEDGGGNTCIRANPWVSVDTMGTGNLFYVKPTGPTYYNPQGHPDHIPGQRNVYISQPYNNQGGFRINILGFPGMSVSAYYTYQGSREDRAAVCNQYARTAVAQNQENLNRKCGFSDTAWQSDYNKHYGWCMTAERSAIDNETRKRDEALKQCGAGGDNRARCDQYARTAVAQNQENLNRRCGFSGATWNSDYNGHFNWCMSADRSWPDSESRKRQESLNRCAPRQTHDFRNPTARGYRVDRCLYWGRDCDKPAADRFCRDNGFVEAESWELAQARPTLILGDGQICNADYCGGFSYIRCVKPR